MHKLQPKTLFVGQNQTYLPYCHSTNDIAAEIGQNTPFVDGSIVITDHQISGRGQRGTPWKSSKEKNLTMSILVDSSFLKLEDQFKLSICTALSVCQALQKCNLKAQIKWPNDLYFGNKKLGGILIENSILQAKLKFSVIGIGINVLETDFDGLQATSLLNEGIVISVKDFAEKVCESFEYHFLKLKEGFNLHQEYLQNLLGLHETRAFIVNQNRVSGMIMGVNPSGYLILDSPLNKKEFDIKEITFCF